jgi:hypothetical protein
MTTAAPAYDRSLDVDTLQKGTEGPFEDWEGDHTALVHILWHARWDGLDLAADAEVLADRIMRSRWIAAARAERPQPWFGDDLGPFTAEDSGLTVLAGVLGEAASKGLSVSGDYDAVASHIMRSRWMSAVRAEGRAAS